MAVVKRTQHGFLFPPNKQMYTLFFYARRARRWRLFIGQSIRFDSIFHLKFLFSIHFSFFVFCVVLSFVFVSSSGLHKNRIEKSKNKNKKQIENAKRMNWKWCTYSYCVYAIHANGSSPRTYIEWHTNNEKTNRMIYNVQVASREEQNKKGTNMLLLSFASIRMHFSSYHFCCCYSMRLAALFSLSPSRSAHFSFWF